MSCSLNYCKGCCFGHLCGNPYRTERCDDFAPVDLEYEYDVLEELIETERGEFFSFWENYINGTEGDDIYENDCVYGNEEVI